LIDRNYLFLFQFIVLDCKGHYVHQTKVFDGAL